MITIFTPSYNRAHLLPRLYESLRRQTLKDFEWLVVDDGSSDNTPEIVKTFSDEDFPVRVFRKENGGKHRAINFALREAKGEWFFILDSDDYLTDNAIELVVPYLKEIEKDERFAGVMALERCTNGILSGGERHYKVLDTDMLSYRTRYHYRAENAEFLRTEILREHPFPEFDGEKFIQESVVWNRIARKYICRYINEVVQIQEYLEGGLTKTADTLMRNNPCGALLYYKEAFTHPSATLVYSYWALGQYWLYYDACPRRKEAMFAPTRKMKWLRPLTLPYKFIRALRHRWLRLTIKS